MTFKETYSLRRFTLSHFLAISLIVSFIVGLVCFVSNVSVGNFLIAFIIVDILIYLLSMAIEEFDGDTRKRVVSTKKGIVSAYGLKFKDDVPDKVIREVYHNGDWREIIEGVKLEKDNKKGK